MKDIKLNLANISSENEKDNQNCEQSVTKRLMHLKFEYHRNNFLTKISETELISDVNNKIFKS